MSGWIWNEYECNMKLMLIWTLMVEIDAWKWNQHECNMKWMPIKNWWVYGYGMNMKWIWKEYEITHIFKPAILRRVTCVCTCVYMSVSHAWGIGWLNKSTGSLIKRTLIHLVYWHWCTEQAYGIKELWNWTKGNSN